MGYCTPEIVRNGFVLVRAKTLPNNKKTGIEVLLSVVSCQYVEASQGWLLLTSLFDLQLVKVLELQSLIQP